MLMYILIDTALFVPSGAPNLVTIEAGAAVLLLTTLIYLSGPGYIMENSFRVLVCGEICTL